MNAKTATKLKVRELLRDRRRANQKRTISTHVRRAAGQTIDGVTNALRKTAKTLRESGALGRVQTRTETVKPGIVQKVYRYTAGQIALIASAYKPRKAEYRVVAARLALAA